MQVKSHRDIRVMLEQMQPDQRNVYNEFYTIMGGAGILSSATFSGLFTYFAVEAAQSKATVLAAFLGAAAFFSAGLIPKIVKEFRYHKSEVTAYYAALSPKNASQPAKPNADRQPKL